MILKGEETILRPVRISDAKKFLEWYSDPEINKFLSREKTTLAKQKKQISLSIKDRSTFNFVIETNEGLPIGQLIFFTDKKENDGSFGMTIGEKEYWSKGFGSDAAKSILKFGFGKLRLNQIHLSGNGTYEYNKRAIRAAAKLGFKREGVLRDRIRYKGKYYDMIPMSMLASEWRKEKLKENF